MTIHEAEQAGVDSFRSGRPMAPALNNDLIQAICETPKAIIPLLDAYIHGWTIAHLAEGMTDEDLPSKQELKRIQLR